MTKVEIIDFFAETYSNIGLYNNFDANNDYFYVNNAILNFSKNLFSKINYFNSY